MRSSHPNAEGLGAGTRARPLALLGCLVKLGLRCAGATGESQGARVLVAL